MKKIIAAAVAIAAAAFVLSGCSSLTPVTNANSSDTPAASGAGSTTMPTSPTQQSTAPTTDSVTFPPGQPPRPGEQDNYPHADSVTGLTAAIARAGHPALQICDGKFFSIITAHGDLRGNGGTQYLVDTTCAGASDTSPDEASLYDVQGSSLTRSAVVYEFSENRPRTTAYPYVWKDHYVVLTYNGGKQYRLVLVTPDRIVPGLVESFS